MDTRKLQIQDIKSNEQFLYVVRKIEFNEATSMMWTFFVLKPSMAQ